MTRKESCNDGYVRYARSRVNERIVKEADDSREWEIKQLIYISGVFLGNNGQMVSDNRWLYNEAQTFFPSQPVFRLSSSEYFPLFFS